MFIVYEEDDKKIKFSELDYGEVFLDPDLDDEAFVRIRVNDMIIDNEPCVAVRLRDGEPFPYREDDLVHKVEARLEVKRIL